MQGKQNIAKEAASTLFGTLAFNRKKMINSIKMAPWNDCVIKNDRNETGLHKFYLIFLQLYISLAIF